MNIICNRIKSGLFFCLLLLGVTVVQAGPIYGFVDAFAPSQWTLQPDQGSSSFGNGNSEIDLTGPTGNFFPSFDAVSVVGPTGAAQWELNFHWTFNAGDSEGSTAFVSWPSEPDGNPLLLASGGPGSTASGDLTIFIQQGETATFLLDSGLTGTGKPASSFVISGFTYSVPDATPWIEASLLLPLLLRRILPAVRRQG